MEKNHRDLVGKSWNTRSRTKNGLSEHTFLAELLVSELLLFLKEVKFNK